MLENLRSLLAGYVARRRSTLSTALVWAPRGRTTTAVYSDSLRSPERVGTFGSPLQSGLKDRQLAHQQIRFHSFHCVSAASRAISPPHLGQMKYVGFGAPSGWVSPISPRWVNALQFRRFSQDASLIEPVLDLRMRMRCAVKAAMTFRRHVCDCTDLHRPPYSGRGGLRANPGKP